jgi:hypothetical protein
MTTSHNQILRFVLFICGQILLTIGLFSLFYPLIHFTASLLLAILGSVLLGFGDASMNEILRKAFPLRLRISLFLFALALIGAAFLLADVAKSK